MTTYNFQHTICYLFILLLISCHSKEEVCSHPKVTVCSHLKDDVLPSPEEDIHLGQTDINFNAYETYLSLKKDLDSIHKITMQKYKTHPDWHTAEDSLYSKRIYKGLEENYRSWQLMETQEDAILGDVYDGGTMSGGVININRVNRIKARLAFYELFN